MISVVIVSGFILFGLLFTELHLAHLVKSDLGKIKPDPKLNEIWEVRNSDPFKEKVYVRIIDIKEDWVKYVYLTDTSTHKTKSIRSFKILFDKEKK